MKSLIAGNLSCDRLRVTWRHGLNNLIADDSDDSVHRKTSMELHAKGCEPVLVGAHSAGRSTCDKIETACAAHCEAVEPAEGDSLAGRP